MNNYFKRILKKYKIKYKREDTFHNRRCLEVLCSFILSDEFKEFERIYNGKDINKH